MIGCRRSTREPLGLDEHFQDGVGAKGDGRGQERSERKSPGMILGPDGRGFDRDAF